MSRDATQSLWHQLFAWDAKLWGNDMYRVAASSLYIRETPTDGRALALLPMGALVEKLGETSELGWWDVRTSHDGAELEGVVASKYLEPIDGDDLARAARVRVPFTMRFMFTQPQASFDRLKRFVGSLADQYTPDDLPDFAYILSKYEIINTRKRLCHFLAQISHETQEFRRFEENLHYSTLDQLMKTFQKYFKDLADAQGFLKAPEALANRVYANRIGNGDEASGDGWRFRGRGFIMLTGRGNYESVGEKLDMDLISDPDLVSRDLTVALECAAAFWDKNKINDAADRNDIVEVTKIVNGGDRGLPHRRALLKKAMDIWGAI